jgi:acyl carrier protein
VSADSREARLRRIIARVAKVAPDSFGADDDLRVALGLDSLSALRVAAGVEREFGVTIPDEKLHDLPTLQAMLDYLGAASRPT